MVPDDPMRNLQAVFDTFKLREYFSYGFLIGTVNHWVTVIANKTQGLIELILLDSRFVNRILFLIQKGIIRF